MKKLAAAILLLVYFTVTTGFVVSVHYCMGKIESAELGCSGDEDCGTCGMTIKKSDGCCKDDIKVVKMNTDHRLAKVAFADLSLAPLQTAHCDYKIDFSSDTNEPLLSLANGPPPNGPETYLRNCVFRL